MLSIAIRICMLLLATGAKELLNDVNNPTLDLGNEKLEVAHSSHQLATVTNKSDGRSSSVHANSLDNVTSIFPPIINNYSDSFETGALIRGFYVFVGLCALVVLYLAFRSYKLRHGRGNPSNIVRKYGIVARRSDLEMKHLELEDDEDEMSLFEIGERIRTTS